MLQAMLTMEPLEVGIWVTGIMMVFVLMGLRVAYAAATAGFIGLIWIQTARF